MPAFHRIRPSTGRSGSGTPGLAGPALTGWVVQIPPRPTADDVEQASRQESERDEHWPLASELPGPDAR